MVLSAIFYLKISLAMYYLFDKMIVITYVNERSILMKKESS